MNKATKFLTMICLALVFVFAFAFAIDGNKTAHAASDTTIETYEFSNADGSNKKLEIGDLTVGFAKGNDYAGYYDFMDGFHVYAGATFTFDTSKYEIVSVKVTVFMGDALSAGDVSLNNCEFVSKSGDVTTFNNFEKEDTCSITINKDGYLFRSITVEYRELPHTTVTYDCTQGGKNLSDSFMVGAVKVDVQYGLSYNKGYPAYGDNNFVITVHPAPGYVINYLTITSPSDNSFESREFNFEGLSATDDGNGNMTFTGFEVGKTYTINTKGSATGLLTAATADYQEHIHSGVYTFGSDEEYHFKQCECLYRVDEEAHTFDEGVITVEPKFSVNGVYAKGTIRKTCQYAFHTTWNI